MNTEIQELLEILGFSNNDRQKMPKMKDVRKQFLKLAKIRHSDKPTGNDHDMKILLEAYKRIGKIIEAEDIEDPNDEEEEKARDLFQQFNFSNVNKNSISMLIYTIHVQGWERTLTEKYGVPNDNSATRNGKKWTIKSFEASNKIGSVFIQIWNKYPQERSTMLIQAEKCFLSLSISFFQQEIPKLFQEVLKHQAHSVGIKSNIQESQLPSNKSEIHCKKCQINFSSVIQLNSHNLNMHYHLSNKFTSSEDTVTSEECDKCKMVFKTGPQLRTHLLNNHGEKVKCRSCKFESSNTQKLEVHENMYHTNISKLQSTNCDYSRKASSNEIEHLKLPNINPLTLSVVDHVTNIMVGEAFKELEKFKCKFCGKRYQREVMLKKHIASIHDNFH